MSSLRLLLLAKYVFLRWVAFGKTKNLLWNIGLNLQWGLPTVWRNIFTHTMHCCLKIFMFMSTSARGTVRSWMTYFAGLECFNYKSAKKHHKVCSRHYCCIFSKIYRNIFMVMHYSLYSKNEVADIEDVWCNGILFGTSPLAQPSLKFLTQITVKLCAAWVNAIGNHCHF